MAQSYEKAPPVTAPTGLYPIREVAERTGVNPITLRAWERRYGLIRPQRTPKGHRLYSEQDIELIKKVVALLETGIPISQVRTVLEQPKQAALTPSSDEDWERHAEALVRGALNLNPGALDAAYRQACHLYPSALLVRQVLRPALQRLRHLEAREPQASHGDSMLRHYLLIQLGHHIWQQTLRNQGPIIVFGSLPGEDGNLEAAFLGLLMVERNFRLVWIPDTMPLLYLWESARTCGASALLLHADLTPSQRLLNQELPGLARHMLVPALIAGEAAAHHGGAFQAAGLEPLPLDSEALLTRLRTRLVPAETQKGK